MGWKGALLEIPVWAAGQFHRPRIDPLRETPRDILVLRPNDFGDLLTTTPLFQALRWRFPSTRIVAGVGRWGRPILENNPYVDEVVELDAPWNNKVVRNQSPLDVAQFIWRSGQVAALRRRNGFDVGIDVLGSHVGALLMMRAKVRYRVGVRGYRGGWSACRSHIVFTPEIHVARAALAQAELLGASRLPEPRPQLYLTDTERAQAAALWRTAGSSQPEPLRLLVGCAAGLVEKSWPAQALIAALEALSHALGHALDIVVVGGAADEAKAAEIVAACCSGVTIRSLAGRVSLRGTFALAEQADVVLTNPSMLLHASAAFRRPTVAVLGGTFADAKAHDTVWGYAPPYSSVAPLKSATGAAAGNWPTVEQVVQAVLRAMQLRGETQRTLSTEARG
jgi:ADP-heptose:LPS heptosyltransferase